MPLCFDTGLLLKLYAHEADSPQAFALAAQEGPIAFTDFHRVELVNALHLKQARREITPADVAKALANIAADVRTGALEWAEPDWKRAFTTAARLSTAHAAATHCRTLDVMHVALSLHLRASVLATTDKRQIALAKAAGLKVLTP